MGALFGVVVVLGVPRDGAVPFSRVTFVFVGLFVNMGLFIFFPRAFIVF